MKKILLPFVLTSFIFSSSFPVISDSEAKIWSGIIGVVSGSIVSFMISQKMKSLQEKLDGLENLKNKSEIGILDQHDRIILEYLEKNKSVFFEKHLAGEDNVVRRGVLVYGSLIATAIIAYMLSHSVLYSWTFDPSRDQLNKDLNFFEQNFCSMDENESRKYGEKLASRISDLDSWKKNEDGLSGLLGTEKAKLNCISGPYEYCFKPRSDSLFRQIIRGVTVGFTEFLIRTGLNSVRPY